MADLSALIANTDIRAAWAELGGGRLRRNRGRAFWRGGDGFNIALYDATCSYHDFATGEGGGVLSLIGAATGCSRSQAAEWLARFHGTTLDSHSKAETARWKRQHRAAESAVELIVHERRRRLAELRRSRNREWDCARIAGRLSAGQSADQNDEQHWILVAAEVNSMALGDATQREIERLENLAPSEFMEMAA